MRGLILCVMSLAAPAIAQGAPAAVDRGNTVAELIIMPRAKCLTARPNLAARAPRIVSTFPANGDVVRPGRLVVRVTFDRPMACSGFLVARPPMPSPCARSRQELVLSLDRRTFRVVCATDANTTYGLRIGDEVLQPFMSLQGNRARSDDLTFSTSGEPAVATVSEFLGEDRKAAATAPAMASAEPR